MAALFLASLFDMPTDESANDEANPRNQHWNQKIPSGHILCHSDANARRNRANGHQNKADSLKLTNPGIVAGPKHAHNRLKDAHDWPGQEFTYEFHALSLTFCSTCFNVV